MFHLIVKDGIKYVCMSDRDVKRRVTFAFLTNVLNSFNERYQERIQTANAYAMNADFAPTLQELMQKFNDPSQDRLSVAIQKVEDVKHIMIQNIEKVLERGENITMLVSRADDLAENTSEFKVESNALRKRMCRKHAKWIAILVGVGVVIVICIIVGVVVNGNSS
jgi:vesicle-associated membrane protein 7